MKKLLIYSMLFIPFMQLHSKSAAEKLIGFEELKTRQCNEWIEHMSRVDQEKATRMQKDNKDFAQSVKQIIKDVNSLADCSEQNKDEWFNKKLNDCLQLYEKHRAAWKKWDEENHKRCQQLAKRHEDEIARFEGNVSQRRRATP